MNCFMKNMLIVVRLYVIGCWVSSVVVLMCVCCGVDGIDGRLMSF